MNSNKNFNIYLTSKDGNKKLEKIKYNELLNKDSVTGTHIKADRNKIKQKLMGFGGALTESSASVFTKLNNEAREKIMDAYYSDAGNNYSMARTHINSCDFSLGNYSYCDVPGDEELKNFSIERDKEILIPFILDAINHSKEKLNILASPWSPPYWMKTNKEMNNGGKLLSEYRNAWANFYCKYIESYEKEGIPIWGVSVQNEPDAKQKWDSCLYSADEERDFIRDFLGPTMKKFGYNQKKIIIWDHNRDLMLKRARTVLEDPDAAQYVWGTGFHWYNGNHFDEVQKTHDEFPDKKLIFTEGCQEHGPHIGSWKLGERYATSIINDLNRWTVAWLDWNILLDDKGGPNHVGNYCSAPIIANTRKQEIMFQSSYFYIGHFSRFLKPGDQIIESENTTKNLLSVSALSKSGNVISVIMNKSNDNENFLYHDGKGTHHFNSPKRSIITLESDFSTNN